MYVRGGGGWGMGINALSKRKIITSCAVEAASFLCPGTHTTRQAVTESNVPASGGPFDAPSSTPPPTEAVEPFLHFFFGGGLK